MTGRRHRRRLRRLAARAAGSVLPALALLAVLNPAPALAATSLPAATTTPQVLMLAVPDLRWSDLSESATPALWRLLGQGSAGALSVKSSWPLAGCADGLLTLGAGDRAAAEPSSAPPVPCANLSRDELAAVNQQAGHTPSLGALAAGLRAHGLRTAALGAGAELALPGADVTGSAAAGLSAAQGADVVLVVDDRIYAAPADQRAAAVRAVDGQLAQLVDPMPADSTVLLVGSSDRGRQPADPGAATAHLHLALARGPDFPPGYLTSPSTKRAPYVELIDLAPTVLGLVGAPVPSDVVGRAWTAAPGPLDPATRAAALSDLDVKAVEGAHWRPPFMWSLSVAALVVVLLGLLVAERGPRSRAKRAVVLACALVAALPVASWLIQLVPWWRWNALVLPMLLLLVSGVVAALAALAAAAGRRLPARALWVVTGVSAAVLVADLVSGSRLQTSALLGDSPITAGRFYGAGNTAFGVLAAAALLGSAVACAVAADRLRSAALRGAALAGVLVGIAAIVDAAPSLGADLGGALALLPSAALLVLLLARIRLTVRRVLAAVAIGAVPLLLLAAWDYHRPPDQRTHIGRFVAQVRDGQAGPVLGRKLEANLGQLVSSPFLPLVLGTVVVVILALRQHRPRLRRALAQHPGLRPAVVALTVCAVLGGLLNDSGVTVTGIMLAVALPMVTALALRADHTDTADGS